MVIVQGVKTAVALLVRFHLCFALIACFWVVSISYRMGSFDFRGTAIVFHNSGGFADSDRVFLAAALALLVGLSGLYRSGRISAVLMVIATLVNITGLDHMWAVLGGDPTAHKAVPSYVFQPMIAAVLICPLTWLFPARGEAGGKLLAAFWAVLALTVCLLGTNTGHNLLGLWSVIGPSYMALVFLCLLVPELVRQAWRLRLALSLSDGPAA